MPGFSTDFHFPEKSTCASPIILKSKRPIKIVQNNIVSYHYLPPSREVSLNDNAVNAIAKVLNEYEKLSIRYNNRPFGIRAPRRLCTSYHTGDPLLFYHNFIGERIDGYEEPCALLTKEAARALKAVSNEMIVQGYRLKVYDAYRPVCAVKHFMLWGIEDQDIRMKPYFYPDLQKQELFEKGYIAKMSSHSRGSTVDLTLLDMKTGKELDMGSPFDLFSEVSHPDYQGVTQEQYVNRMILQRVMVRHGFQPFDYEWWHFTLKDEPYPDTYFKFPVSSEYLRR